MSRYIEIMLKKRNVKAIAQLMDNRAPKTCEAVWQALPLEGNVYHAKFASNEIYTLTAPFAEVEPGIENPTMMPIPGDLIYWHFPPGSVYIPDMQHIVDRTGVIDLAIFYDRNNFLFSPSLGPVPGNLFGTITENFDAIVEACVSIWREGFVGERLSFRRLE